MATAMTRTDDDNLGFLGKIIDFQRICLVDCQRHSVRDFWHEGEADGRNTSRHDNGAWQDIPEQSAAINCSHLFAPWFMICWSANSPDTLILITFYKRTWYGAAKT
jgi:hypothetical protein